jgi:DNA-directed RNA polymerase specialized sigma24 family protein
MKSLSKDWQPTQEDFDQFLIWLNPDRDLAGERYERIHRMLTTSFAVRWRGDAQNLADETLTRVIRQVVVEKKNVDNAEAYCRGVAKIVLLESFRKLQKENAISVEMLTLGEVPVAPPHQEEREAAAEDAQYESYLEAFRRCLKELPRPEREMVIKYYDGSKEGELKKRRLKLARRLNLKIGNLRSRMVRRREQLRKCIKKRLQMSQPFRKPDLS